MSQNIPAKIPTDSTDWNEIDIFVFSNGQQHSPPRKYHLHTDDLRWWEATLNYMARSQYGSMHSVIELYTINGTKLEGPIQLQNGAAYVAVEPPDSFVDTGYYNYLIKASRSWEKRQSKKCCSLECIKNEEVINMDTNEEEISKPHIKDELEAINKIPTNITAILRNTERHATRTTLVIKSRNNNQSNKKESLSNTDQKLNEKDCPIITKKYNTNQRCPLASRRGPVKRQDSSSRRFNDCRTVKATNKPAVIGSAKGQFRSKIKTSCEDKRNYIFPKNQKLKANNNTTTEKSILKLESVFTPAQDNCKENYKLNNMHNNNVIENKDDSNIFKNTNNEVPSIIINADSNSIKYDKIEKENQSKEITAVLLNEKHINDQAINHTSEIENNENIYQPCKCDKDVECNISSEDYYTAVMNKGDVLNLNLKIEITDTNNTKSSIVKCISHSITNSVKKGKTLQVNRDENIFVEKHSLQSILANELTKKIGNNKVIVFRCQCCDKCENISTNSEDKKSTNKFPSNSKLKENVNRCQCLNEDRKLETNTLQNTNGDPSHNEIYPIKKTLSIISMERITKLDAVIPELHNNNSETTSKVSSLKSQCNISIENQKIPEKKCEHCEIQRNASKLLEKDGKDIVEVIPNPSTSSKNIDEKATQTDWCDVLLIAKCHTDGRYFFHLPSLHVLKEYKPGI